MNPHQDFKPNFKLSADALKQGVERPEKGKSPAENLNNLNNPSATIFPIDVFPMQQQLAIDSLYNDLNYPKDFTAAGMLFAVSLAIGNTHRVEVKTAWLESANIYLAVVSPPGTNKTHPLRFALQPIRQHDKNTYHQYELLRQEYEKAITLTKSEREEQGIDEPVRPVWMKHLLSDYTPEALADVHKYNKRGIGVYVDELAGWFKNFNKYNRGSETEFWLSTFSNEPITIDRKTVEPTYINQPFISVAGTIQNGLLLELAKDRTQNGFIDRILFVCPDDVKKSYFNDRDLNEAVIQGWSQTLSRLLDETIALDEENCVSSKILRFNPRAKKNYMAWQRNNADLCNKAETEALKGIYSKFDIYTIRLALILQMLYWATGEGDKAEVSERAVQGAIKLVEYFRKSAYRVQSIISDTDPTAKLSADKKEIYNALPDSFSTQTALDVANNLGLPVSTLKRFLTAHTELFKRVTHGQYEKVF